MKVYRVIAKRVCSPLCEHRYEHRYYKTNGELLSAMKVILPNFDMIINLTIERVEITEEEYWRYKK